MIILPDTNVWINLLNLKDTPIAERFRKEKAERIKLCSVVKAELYFGAYKSSRKRENLALLDRLFQTFESLPFDDRAAKICGNIRARLAALGSPIGPNDLLIGSIAMAHRAILITHNTREFGRIAGLKTEDWE